MIHHRGRGHCSHVSSLLCCLRCHHNRLLGKGKTSPCCGILTKQDRKCEKLWYYSSFIQLIAIAVFFKSYFVPLYSSNVFCTEALRPQSCQIYVTLDPMSSNSCFTSAFTLHNTLHVLKWDLKHICYDTVVSCGNHIASTAAHCVTLKDKHVGL